MQSDFYQNRGVSASKDEVKEAVSHLDQGLFPGAFCKIEPDMAGDPEYCSILHADGAGTKSSLAYLRYRESGDPRVFCDIAQDSLVMNTDDVLAVGCTGPFYLSNTIGRNAQRIPGEVINAVIHGYQKLAERLSTHGVEVFLTGGETADVGDLVQTIICDSTLACRMRRADVIDASHIGPGQVIVGLSSYGQTSYEERENSGIASNGLTAARHLLLNAHYRERYPESYASSLSPKLAYVGQYYLSDELPGSTLSVGEALQSPTRTYLPIIKPFLESWREQVYGLIHNTGGALTKVLSFGQPGTRIIKDRLLPRPPIFQALAAQPDMSARELYQVFNMGQLFEVYCSQEAATALIEIASSFDCQAQIIGRTEDCARGQKELIIRDQAEEYFYQVICNR